MNPESIKARISIGKHEQGDIAFIYDFNVLNILNVPEDKTFNGNYFLNIGTIIEINEIQYKITSIKTLFYDKTFDMSNPPGVNMYGIGEKLDFNFEISYFVESI